jgi:preprotein translocase subunit SecD
VKPLLALLLLAATVSAAAPAAERAGDDRLSAEFPRVAGEKGLFVGSIRVCRGTVAQQVRRVADPGGSPALQIVFTPAAAERLRSETAALVGRPMRIRIHGRTVMAPVVLEEIGGGTVHISGPPARDLPEMRRAALRRC